MKKQTRNLLIAAAVVLVLVIIAYWYWFTKDTVKLALTGLTVDTASGALTLAYTYSGKKDMKEWTGKKVTIHTKSLGKIHTTVASATSTDLKTADSAYKGSTAYKGATDDYARVTLKF